MTNREALQAETPAKLSDDILDRQLRKQGLNPFDEADETSDDNNKSIDLALAGVIFWMCQLPESVKELDYQLTQRDIDGLMRLRSILLAKWDEPDPYGVAQITDISDLH